MGEVLKRMKGGRFVGWSIRYYDVDGRRRVRATRQPSRAEAKKLLVQIEARVARGLFGLERDSAAGPELASLTVAELCARFLASAHPRAKDAAAYRRAADYSLRPVLPLLGKIPLHKLRRRDIEEARDRLGATRKPNSVRASLRPLASALSWAVRQELIAQSPMAKLALPRREQSTEHLLPEDASKLLAEAEAQARARDGGENEWTRFIAVALALRLGLRRGEIFGLRWRDVDLAQQRLTVARSYEGLPKNGRSRTLPIPSPLGAALREWRARCPASAVRVCAVGERVQRSIRRLLQDAGCPPLVKGWHALRHTFASTFVAQGGSILTLKELLGHSSLDMTLIYSHVAPAALVADLEKMKL